MNIKTIFFDFFGVISSEVAPFWFQARFDEKTAKTLKEKYMSPADKGDINEEIMFKNLSELSGESPEKICSDFLDLAVINKDVVAMIDKLSKNYKIVLLSNAQDTWLHKILTRDNLYKCFDLMIISAEVGLIKPNSEIFNLALLRSNSKAEESVFIDDNPINVSAAERVGIKGLVFSDIEKLKKDFDAIKIKY